MSARDVEIRDGDGEVLRLRCESYERAVELALRLTHGTPADLVQVTFAKPDTTCR